MANRALSIDATDDEIKSLVVEWSELLAEKRFKDALALFPSCSREFSWTPDLLEKIISGYGVLDPDNKAIEWLLKHHGVSRFEITSLLGRPDKDEIISDRINVDRKHLFGLDPKDYLGMVHYDDVPLSGMRSDLTARFNIKRVGTNKLTLEFSDIHVM